MREGTKINNFGYPWDLTYLCNFRLVRLAAGLHILIRRRENYTCAGNATSTTSSLHSTGLPP